MNQENIKKETLESTEDWNKKAFKELLRVYGQFFDRVIDKTEEVMGAEHQKEIKYLNDVCDKKEKEIKQARSAAISEMIEVVEKKIISSEACGACSVEFCSEECYDKKEKRGKWDCEHNCQRICLEELKAAMKLKEKS